MHQKKLIRADINGLRGIAVLAVVAFHFSPDWFPGGFIGVDLFFVISGYLMTSIIIRGVEQKSFDLWTFYSARANRIIPALTVVCGVLLVFGWYFLPPFDYRVMLEHIGASLLFVSNIVYWRESGYFDLGAYDKWLLHTWSLSVEWQFYLFYPLLLLYLTKLTGLKNIRLVVLLVTVFSFLFNLYAVNRWPNASYFLLPTRSWELLAGALVYLYPIPLSVRWIRMAEWLGFGLLLSSFWLVSKSTAWPGSMALLPVVGTMMVLHANRQDSMATNNVLFQRLGTWSYSIYLWHWVVVVLVYQLAKTDPSVYQWLPLFFLLSLLMGAVSYLLIEQRRRGPVKTAGFAAVLTAAIICIITLPSDIESYLPRSVAQSLTLKSYECFDQSFIHDQPEAVCQLTEGSDDRTLVLGDSHMLSILPALETLSKEYDFALDYVGYSGCPPIIDVFTERSDQHKKDCNQLNARTLRYALENQVETVFLAARWTLYTDGDYLGKDLQFLMLNEQESASQDRSIRAFRQGISATIEAFSSAGIRVVLMLQVPLQNDVPERLYYWSLEGKEINPGKLAEASVDQVKSESLQSFTNEIIFEASQGKSNVLIVDPSSYLCSEGKCLVGSTGHSYYFDDDHLSVAGAAHLRQLIEYALITPEVLANRALSQNP